MAVRAGVLKDWLRDVLDWDEVAIDEGGLTIYVVDDPEMYYEIGGE